MLDALTDRLGDRGSSFRAGLIQTWREECTTRLADLGTAVAARDGEAVARIAHTLKSSSGSLGALALARVCDEIETRLRAGGGYDLAVDAARIRTGIAQAVAAFDLLWQ